ncbi:MAG: helix-turn-helix transcriptional regulator [Oscillospiraceae bacterium]|nr:helix-turn-helix transcriptional regulator [Oscillospiraceae bacterium]
MSLGEKIQQLRKDKGLSQEQLAEILNVSRQAISKWETDQSSPEIEKILALSKAFSISTDELLGNSPPDDSGESAGNENSVPQDEPYYPLKEAVKNKKSIKINLPALFNRKVLFIIFSFLCFTAFGTCFIVNYAIERQITWAAYIFISVPFFWLSASLLFIKKHGITLSLCAFTLFTVPYIYFLEKITPVNDWFEPVGLPCAAVGIASFWFFYLLFRFLKISLWYKFAITAFLAGAIISPVTNMFINNYLDETNSFFEVFINLFSSFIITAVFGFIGFTKKKKAP